MIQTFKTLERKSLPLPLFFPDATRGFVRQLNWDDVKQIKLPGVLVNTFHLLRDKGTKATLEAGGIRPLIGWDGAIISDSGGFQVMSIAKRYTGNSAITDEGVTFEIDGEKHLFTPEDSIRYQMTMQTDLMVVLDDFTPPDATFEEAEETVRRTTLWAKRCKETYDSIIAEPQWQGKKHPYLIGVVQGGFFKDLRLRSVKELTEIGFDGYGYGGWPVKDGIFDTETAELIADNVPKGALLYGLGIGKPDDIVKCVNLGWDIFDCVLPTRDARHGRLYVYRAGTIESIDVHEPDFYEYYNPTHASHAAEKIPVSKGCDCELCTSLTREELHKMWKARDQKVLRLATIHNLRFYAVLMDKLQKMVK